MTFSQSALQNPRPHSVRQQVVLPRRQTYHPSPADWRDEILYFLLVDRFSDGQEANRPLLDRSDLVNARPAAPDGSAWRWDRWAQSGSDRYQGGTLAGITSKLDYLAGLGVSTLWVSPIFTQRAHLDTYHGYGIQDLLDVDPRFGTRQDLVDLCAAAHARSMRIVLDIIFNHSGSNWTYPDDTPGGSEKPFYTTGRYDFGAWRDGSGASTAAIGNDPAAGIWPEELQDPDGYTRAGTGSLGAGDLNDPAAEHKRSDFENLRDFNLDYDDTLGHLAACYKYWIALTDCDGFRIDTLKHLTQEQARNFCGTIQEFGINIGKLNFLLIGEVAGGDNAQAFYLGALGRNLSAVLDIGEMRPLLGNTAKGLVAAGDYFWRFNPGEVVMGSHRNLGNRHVSVLDDHDHVSGPKLRTSAEAVSDIQVVAGTATQLLTLGIPCVYYGTEQSFAGPEPSERPWLPGWGGHDRYLREAMFGPEHPRKPGRAGLPDAAAPFDPDLPGFGPFGTAGRHCFDPASPAYIRIAALAAVRQDNPTLRHGRQYSRPIALFDSGFFFPPAGEIIAWSRILDDEECLCVVNPHGQDPRGGDVLIDANLNAAPGAVLTVIANTAQAAAFAPGTAYTGTHPVGSTVPVRRGSVTFVEIRTVLASETLILSNRPNAEPGGIQP
jgi:glycosidase